MRFTKFIPVNQAKQICQLACSADCWTRHVAIKIVDQSGWIRKWQLAGGDPAKVPGLASFALEQGFNARGSSPSFADRRQEEMKAWMALQVQGVGEFRNDRISNLWLADPRRAGFRQRHYFAGLVLWTGTYLYENNFALVCYIVCAFAWLPRISLIHSKSHFILSVF